MPFDRDKETSSGQSMRVATDSREQRIQLLAWSAYVLAIVVVVAVFFGNWQQPLLDQHAFRQTQTAVSVYWGIVDGWALAYQTPVLGAPWSVPFEFPIFQWVVSACWGATGLPLDSCGRATSFVFFVGSSGLLMALMLQLRVAKVSALVGAILYLIAPNHLFWGRAFLIESCAVFFTLAFAVGSIAAMQADLKVKRRVAAAVPLALLAVVATLTKVTTFLAGATFVMLVSLYVAYSLLRAGGESGLRDAALRIGCAAAVPLVTAFVAVVAWVSFSDAVKAANPIAQALTSAHLGGWNYGSLGQRLSPELWIDTVLGRSIPETLGWGGLAVVAMGMIFVRGTARLALLGLLVAYLVSFLAFPNLHIVHNYYQMAVGVWAVAALAVVLDRLRGVSHVLFVAAALAVGANQVHEYGKRYHASTLQSFNTANSRTLALAASLQRLTQPDDVIVALGYDWSSELAYYAQRRAITIPNWQDPAQRAAATIDALAFPHKIGALVDCGSPEWLSRGLEAQRQRLESSIRVAGCDIRVASRNSADQTREATTR
jgi:hypothetical protein